MKTRLILVTAGAAVLLLAMAAPALAMRVADAGVPYGWLLQLRGAKNTSLTTNEYRAWQKAGVAATVVDDNKTPDIADDLAYTGVPLWRLVGKIDDADPGHFNYRLATTAPGYNVVVRGVDGYAATFTSVEVATMRNTLVVADRVNGAPLTLGTASIKNPMTVDEYASWKPMWPLKVVTNDATVFNSRKAAGVVRITIAPATAMRVADAGVPYGWLLQLRGAKNTSLTTNEYRAWQKAGVAATVVDDNKTPDIADDLAYTGVPLWRLVGKIDDADPGHFNYRLATTAPGYNVVVRGVDGYAATFTSVEVATMRNTLVVADRVNGAPLTLGTASIKNPMTVDEYASWKPMWPLKVVTNDATVFNSRKAAGVVRITIAPATAPGSLLPFDQEVSAESPASRAVTGPDDPPEGGWTLTLIGKRTKVLPIDKVPATVIWDGTKAGNINPSLRYVYKGQSLFRLVGLVDDSTPRTFNIARAKKGYTIQFICRDGYKPKISSRLILKNGKPRVHWIVAKIKAGKLLEGGEAPFRFVGGPPITQPFNNKLSAYGIVKIRLIF